MRLKSVVLWRAARRRNNKIRLGDTRASDKVFALRMLIYAIEQTRFTSRRLSQNNLVSAIGDKLGEGNMSQSVDRYHNSRL